MRTCISNRHPRATASPLSLEVRALRCTCTAGRASKDDRRRCLRPSFEGCAARSHLWMTADCMASADDEYYVRIKTQGVPMSWQPSNDPVLGDPLSCDALELVIVPRTRDLGDGFEVRRALPHGKRQMVGPFIFF